MHRSKSFCQSLTCLLMILGLSTIASPPLFAQATTATAIQTQAQKWVDNTHAAYHLPGFSVAVIHQGQRVFIGQAGWADLEHQVPVSADTSFRMGSLSKLFTVGLAAKLVQAGLLQWNDAITKYLASAPTQGRAPTIAELASCGYSPLSRQRF